MGAAIQGLGALVASEWAPSPPLWAAQTLTYIVPILGLLSVYTSVMIYSATGRPAWSFPITASKFYGSCALLGSSVGLLSASIFSDAATLPIWVAFTVVFGAAKLTGEGLWLSKSSSSEDPMSRESAALLTGTLSPERQRRTLLCGVGLLATLVTPLFAAPIFAAIGFSVLLLSEYLERRLFFMSVVPFRMPRSLQ